MFRPHTGIQSLAETEAKKKTSREQRINILEEEKRDESTGKHTFPTPNYTSDSQGGGEADRVLFYIVWCKEVKTDTDRCAHTDRTGLQM